MLLTKKRDYNNLEDRKIWNDVIIARMKKIYKEDKEKKIGE
tara:strand:- start:388 stop:510 length:123 start_codon:yes stop_codon:yes gene_type:complete